MSSWIPATAAARAGRTAPAADATRAGVAAAVALGAGVPDTAAAQALGGQWHVGAGGGASLLEPDDSLSLGVDDNAGTGATLFLGRDLDDRSSVQVQPYSPGKARFDGGSTVGYRGGDANVLYRFLDTRDTNLFPPHAEPRALRPLRSRLPGARHRRVARRRLSGVLRRGRRAGARHGTQRRAAPRGHPPRHRHRCRFGLAVRRGPLRRRAHRPAAPHARHRPGSGAVAERDPRLDAGRARHRPVDRGRRRRQRGTAAARARTGRDDRLPGRAGRRGRAGTGGRRRGRIELHAHTDDLGTPREQAIVTRARLRTVGAYLVGRGVGAGRLVLRSFGGSRSVASNDPPAGRAANDRIEVLENAPGQPGR